MSLHLNYSLLNMKVSTFIELYINYTAIFTACIKFIKASTKCYKYTGGSILLYQSIYSDCVTKPFCTQVLTIS